nr:immunoglobulin light chain junction region [Macaca mulatta]MOV67023.1 immunoglobulin light chain junction region [Macaca mulatta]MOV67105.1 immunoglobulin light chain junction region [Macaca mulatta]MOV67581.1 immunoglobulin light chain junction region [Macaca mulatta]MOV69002.1 immunoglobulin light chain junction region [Macaca mulatta]
DYYCDSWDTTGTHPVLF